jgi:chromosomal replication initiator protein
MHDAIWEDARRRLRECLPAKDYETWIGPLRAAQGADEEITLEVPSAFGLDWIRTHLWDRLAASVGDAAGRPVALKLVVNRGLGAPAPVRRPVRRAEPEAAVRDPQQNGNGSRCRFDTFVVGETNRVAYEAARAVVQEPGRRYNPLFVYGGTGLGKTHLLTAAADASVGAAGPRTGVLYVTAEAFVNELIGSLKRHQMERFRHRFRRIGTLIIDDIQFLGDKKRSQEEFTHTFNALHDGRKQIVIASDRPPHALPGFEETLRNRFSSGLLADIQPPDAALRLALVRRKAGDAALALDDEVAAYVAERWCQNGRQLEGVLRRIEAFSQLAGKPVTLGLVREALAPFRGATEGRKSLGRIVGEVCRQFQVTRTELTSPARTARITLPRHVAMYLCRRHTDAPLNVIGKEFGGRDHSTVVHALGTIETRLRQDAELRATVSLLEARLGG